MKLSEVRRKKKQKSMILGQHFSFSNFLNFRNLDIGFSINLKIIIIIIIIIIIFIIIIITFLHREIGFSKPIYIVKMFLMKFF